VAHLLPEGATGMSDPDQASQSMIANLPQKTGRSLEQ